MKILFFIQQVFNLVGFLLMISHVNMINGQVLKSSNIVSIDAKEGDTIRLPCKINFSKNDIIDENLAYFWMRKNNTNAENVAFRNTILEQEFSLETDLSEGKYDLIIKSASYYRDNRKFECIVKRPGSKEKETTIAYQLTILIAPGSPIIRPELPIAREDEPFELTCYSTGGSPSPEIEWFRNGIPIPGEITPGLNKDMPTKSVLKIIPTMADDRLPYSCKVYNRATTKENATEAQVSLTVYYTPRVAVGPYNPLNVLKADNAYMTCSVVANPPPKRIYWLRNNKTIGSSINHSILNIDPSDTGLYTCIAENGILDKQGQNGIGELQLNVLYAPIVTLPNKIIEPKSDEQVNITCEVNSNPKPHTVSWYKLVHNVKKLVQEGAQMIIRKVRPEDSGIYVCIAQNTLKASENSISQTHSANSTVEIKVKHAPELVVITPEKPVAISGRSFNLTCKSQPEAHPKPTYKWWKEGDENIISNSAELLFKIVHIRQEGKYYCSAENELGTSEVSSVNLVINEPPSLTFKMKPEIIKKQGERAFSLTCRARGKPTPKVFWYHNNQLITNEPQYNVNNYVSYDVQPVSMYRVETNDNLDSSNTVESILHFESQGRKNNDELVAHDHGRYYCMFDNGLTDQPVKSGTFVKVEHAPILKHEHNRVAFDSGEYAALQCKMSAYPKPSFEWYFENHLIDRSYGSQPKYNFSLVEIGDDVWMSTLFIANVKKTDYGDYTCRSWNTLSDDEKTIIKLVEKSAPETPSHMSVVEIQSDFVILSWQSGFNGGYHNTEYILSYSNEDSMFSKWRNETCRTMNPCKLTNLLSRKNYQFKVMATNPKGHSLFSEPVEGKTKVSFKDIPIPYEAYYDNAYNMVTFKIDSNELDLIVKVEVKTTTNTDVDIVDGEEISEQEHWKLLITSEIKNENSHFLNLPIIESSTSPSPGSEKNLVAKSSQYNDMRVSICLKSNTTLCSLTQTIKMDYVSSYQREKRVYSIEQLILIILVGGSLALGSVIFIFVFCVKKREKINKKDYDSESESDNRVKVNTISNNYFNSNDSKALVDSQDDSTKMMPPPVYSTTPNTPTSTIGGNNGLSQNLQLNGNNNYGTTNYFLNGSDPSPNSSNETTHSDIWMMKNEIILPDNQQFVNQSHYGTHPQNMLVNNVGNTYQVNNYGSPLDYSYSYYPRNQSDEYRHLTEDNYNMNVKNSLYAPYYEESNYGTTMQITNNQPPMPPPIPMDSNDYFNSQQPTYQQQLAFEDETSYNNSSNSNGNSRVIREIIV